MRLLRKFYLRVDADRLRLDATDVGRSFDDLAVLAVSTLPADNSRILAVGRQALSLEGHSGLRLIRPFGHPRAAIHELAAAEKLLAHACRELLKGQSWYSLRPMSLVILHPLRPLEGGLTEIERRALQEMAENVGARKVVFHQGRELTAAELRDYDFRIWA